MIDMSFDFSKLEARRLRLRDGVRKSAKASVADTTRAAEKALEQATAGVTKGNLYRAWASETYPRGNRMSDTPAGIIYVNGSDRTRGPIRAFTQGATIAGKRGQQVAVPLPGVREAFGSALRGRYPIVLTPKVYTQRTGRRLVPIVRPGKPTLLAYRTPEKIVPVFILMKQVTLQARLSFAQILAPFPARLRTEFMANLRALPEWK